VSESHRGEVDRLVEMISLRKPRRRNIGDWSKRQRPVPPYTLVSFEQDIQQHSYLQARGSDSGFESLFELSRGKEVDHDKNVVVVVGIDR
jgi:hypothetical protein